MTTTPVIWHRVEMGQPPSPPFDPSRIGMTIADIRHGMMLDFVHDDLLLERVTAAAVVQLEQYTGELWGRREYIAHLKTVTPCKAHPAGHWRGGGVTVTAAEHDGVVMPPPFPLDHRTRVTLDNPGEWQLSGEIGHTTAMPENLQLALICICNYVYDGRLAGQAETMTGWVHKSGATAYLSGHMRSHAAPAEAIPI